MSDQAAGRRAALAASLRARMASIRTPEQAKQLLLADAEAEARQLADLMTEDSGPDIESELVSGWFHWYRYTVLPSGPDRAELESAVRMLTPGWVAGVESTLLPNALLPILATRVSGFAGVVLARSISSADPDCLGYAIDLMRRIVAVIPVDRPERASCLRNLEVGLHTRFQRTGASADLDEMIEVDRRAVAEAASGPDRAAPLANLGVALRTRFKRTEATKDLEEAIEVNRAAVAITPADHPGRAILLSNLGVALRSRFEHVGVAADLDEAIEVGREAVAVTPSGHPSHTGHLTNLKLALTARYEQSKDVSDLDESIEVIRTAVALTPPDHPERTTRLANLGITLRARFLRTGAAADIDEAIEADREAVSAAPMDTDARVTLWSNLAIALHSRFGQTEQAEDIDEAIELERRVVSATSVDDPDRVNRVANLGASLHARFGQSLAQADIDEAIELAGRALDATPTDSPDRVKRLANLRVSLRDRFEWAGAPADLDEAIVLGRQAVAVTPTGHSAQAANLAHLGDTLRVRFTRTGTATDIDEAIEWGRLAVAATPTDDRDRANRLSNLGFALHARYARTWASADIDEAIAVYREAAAFDDTAGHDRATVWSNLGLALDNRYVRTRVAADLDEAIQLASRAVAATPADHRFRAKRLSNLGTSLHGRYLRTEAAADLDDTIEAHRAAVAAASEHDTHRATMFSNLGTALATRFARTETPADLDEAIRLGGRAVAATPADHPDRAIRLFHLGSTLGLRYGRLEASAADLDAAIGALEESADLRGAGPWLRVLSARTASVLAAPTQPSRAAALLELAVELLPEIAPRALERKDQQQMLGDFAELAADAAALALDNSAIPIAERPTVALRLLDAGRAVMLSQILHLRGDLSDLTDEHPDLARRFIELRDQLDTPPGVASTIGPVETEQGGGAPDRTIRDRHRLVHEFDDLLGRIRALPGFESFALPPSRDELLAQAAHGPVVVFNISQYRSDALLLTASGITALPMAGLARNRVIDRINTFHTAVHTSHDRSVTGATRMEAQQQLNTILEWLWDNAAEPVLNELGYRGAHSSEPPRVWWAPGGLLGLLPLHAAGYHRGPSGSDDRAVIDRVVSSYTPTVTALRYARRHSITPIPVGARQALIVAMPTTPGGDTLDCVSDEVDRIVTRLPVSVTLTEPDPGDAALVDPDTIPTKANVLDLLPHYPIAHFACHGTTDPADPSRNRLLLHDHTTDPLTISALAPIRLDRAQLAYLSACNTALTLDERLLDEAIHLTAAFQLAGYPHVIGTLWAIYDKPAAEIADHFYAGLTAADSGGTLTTQHSARALHHTVRAFRETRRHLPSLWAGYLHAGA